MFIPLTRLLFHEKAFGFAEILEAENLQASVGWLHRFREWYRVVAKCISGKSSDDRTVKKQLVETCF